MGEHLISTRAVERRCRCGSTILAGLDEGLPVRVDATPVDRAGELAALLEGRWTFARSRVGLLIHRNESRVRGGLVGESIHAQHRCERYRQPSLMGMGR